MMSDSTTESSELRTLAEKYATFAPSNQTHGAIALRDLAGAVLALLDGWEQIGWRNLRTGYLHDLGVHGLVCEDDNPCEPIYTALAGRCALESPGREGASTREGEDFGTTEGRSSAPVTEESHLPDERPTPAGRAD